MGAGGRATPSRTLNIPILGPFWTTPRSPSPLPTLRARSPPPGAGVPWEGSGLSKGRDYGPEAGNLVKTTKCHRKVSKRPVIVPISQNGSEKSPLEILRFLFLVAFSHKELMVPFEASRRVYCQNDEVSTVCTCSNMTVSGSRSVRRYPHSRRQQAALCRLLLIWLSAVFSTDPFTLRN